ncbi:MAG: hypothetical protein KBT20_09750 [Bacteroidales bacterium]|nr:hypothetical protein [Candidatus Liminaster caballi]
MKKLIISLMAAMLAVSVTTPARAEVDDDIYFSKKAAKKAIYEATEDWSTDANDDWDIDAYNRRGDASLTSSDDDDTKAASLLGNAKTQRDTVILVVKEVEVDPYAYSYRIHRFHNSLFGFYAYSPWYDVAYYDPFYWDYCYWDPWWWRTPSFGYHWGSWYVGWNPGYYAGWYGGWYSPYYPLQPHHFGPGTSVGVGGSHWGNTINHRNRGNRNNVGSNTRTPLTANHRGFSSTSVARNSNMRGMSNMRGNAGTTSRPTATPAATTGRKASTNRTSSANTNRTSSANATRQAVTQRTKAASRETNTTNRTSNSSAYRGTQSTPTQSSRSTSSYSTPSRSSSPTRSSSSYSAPSRSSGSVGGGGSRGGRR